MAARTNGRTARWRKASAGSLEMDHRHSGEKKAQKRCRCWMWQVGGAQPTRRGRVTSQASLKSAAVR
eukprot:7048958-Prymnesium_polylepis.2